VFFLLGPVLVSVLVSVLESVLVPALVLVQHNHREQTRLPTRLLT